eukprot:10433276-Karenia_brevis.AAC.1
MLSEATELALNGSTYFSPKGNYEARYDRVLVSTPPWLLKNLRVSGSVAAKPRNVYLDGISDHTVTTFALQLRECKCNQSRPTPSWVTKSKIYQKLLSKRLKGLKADAMPVNERLNVCKQVMRETGVEARNLIDQAGNVMEARDMALSTMGRVVALNDKATAT